MDSSSGQDAKASAVDRSFWNVSPLDGRYQAKLSGLGELVGEGALICYRLRVESAWLLHLADIPALAPFLAVSEKVRSELALTASGKGLPYEVAVSEVKQIEKVTNHDVKAVEYYLQRRLAQLGAPPLVQAFVHFSCTSEDINNLAYAMMLRDVMGRRLLPLLADLIRDLTAKVRDYAGVAMLARTHGQTATPTTLGKELAVFARRLVRQEKRLKAQPIEGKINGAVGNYNAHLAAFPAVDWPAVARQFVETKLGLTFNPLTTQIESHDSFVEAISNLQLVNTILIGLCRDIWGYISLGYFRQNVRPGEVGSSTMPHKVNPIDFENAEGNLGLANALAAHFAEKLPISRWQRDLSDSTVLRAFGTIIGHTELAWGSLRLGLSKISVDAERIAEDLDGAWEVLAEPVQTVLRSFGVVDAYDRLKALTRGRAVTQAALLELIDQTNELPEPAKAQLRALSPSAYTGLAEQLALAFAASQLGQ